jgi:hypothetical protein
MQVVINYDVCHNLVVEIQIFFYPTKEFGMKKIGIALIILIILSSLSMTVGAGNPAELNLHIRNQSGAVVALDLVDAGGNHLYKTLPQGVFPITLTEGVYSYYASLPCGNISGHWNINVVKTLYLSCMRSVPVVQLAHLQGGQALPGCFVLTWDSGANVLFFDGLNWDHANGSSWAEVLTAAADWETWGGSGGLDGPATFVDCANPPAYTSYYDHIDIYW